MYYCVMKIAVNTRLLLPNKMEGLGTFKHEVLQRIVKNNPSVEFHFLFDRPFDIQFIYSDNIIPHSIFPQARHPFLYIAWFDYALPSFFKKNKIDLFFSPDGYLSLNTKIPQIPIIHDLNFEHYPNYFSYWHRWHYLKYFPQYAKKATQIGTVSEFSKSEINKLYGIPNSKIEVVYNGINQTTINISKEEKIKIQEKYSEKKPYFVFIGAIYPRKNLINQIKAFEQFKKSTNSEYNFLIIGKTYPESHEIINYIQQSEFNSCIKVLGRIDPREEVDKIIASAQAMLYVSEYEGFGIPVLEGMRCGIPVITSSTSSLPEVVNDAAIKVNPVKIEEITDALISVQNQKNDLTQKGYENIKRFSWDNTAEKVWNLIQKI